MAQRHRATAETGEQQAVLKPSVPTSCGAVCASQSSPGAAPLGDVLDTVVLSPQCSCLGGCHDKGEAVKSASISAH